MIVSFSRWISQAEIAQPVEHFTRNEGVVSSNLIFGLRKNPRDFMSSGFFDLQEISLKAGFFLVFSL